MCRFIAQQTLFKCFFLFFFFFKHWRTDKFKQIITNRYESVWICTFALRLGNIKYIYSNLLTCWSFFFTQILNIKRPFLCDLLFTNNVYNSLLTPAFIIYLSNLLCNSHVSVSSVVQYTFFLYNGKQCSLSGPHVTLF